MRPTAHNLLRGTQEGTQDLSFEKETQTGFTVFIQTYIKRYIHTIAWKTRGRDLNVKLVQKEKET